MATDMWGTPCLIHNCEHLEREQVLSKIISTLEDDIDGLSKRVGIGEDDPQGCLG